MPETYHAPVSRSQQLVWVGIFGQSLVATVGSLYFSTFGDIVANIQSGNLFPFGDGFVPCDLCWYARILMYPIVVISYIGIAKQDRRFTDYILPLSILGILLDSYHYAIQKFPIPTFFTCSAANPCSALQVDYFGFITIPFLALVAFIVITILSLVNMRMNRRVVVKKAE
jgi:disulfide bond formation protein DsbB